MDFKKQNNALRKTNSIFTLQKIEAVRELVFLQKNKNKWVELEAMLQVSGPKDPDKLSALYIQLNDDLSYARTYYPQSNVVTYLNDLSVQLHKEIYRNKKEDKKRIWTFFKKEFPLALHQQKNYNLITLIVFLLALILGWISAEIDGNFTRMMMGNNYVDQTLENIAGGKAMNIYGQSSEGKMFLQIGLNNLYVVVLYFLMGIVGGLGALALLFRFGIFIGSFFQFMYLQDVFAETMLAMWIHGVIEIACALIGTAAGTRWGMSIIFPKTYSRSYSFMKAGRESFKVLVGLLPFIVVAAFIESYITRYYDQNIWVSIAIILLTFLFILYYFVLYPYQLNLQEQSEKDANR